MFGTRTLATLLDEQTSVLRTQLISVYDGTPDDVDMLLHFIGDGHPAGLRMRLTSSGWRNQIRRLAIERSRTALNAIAHATGVYFPRRGRSGLEPR